MRPDIGAIPKQTHVLQVGILQEARLVVVEVGSAERRLRLRLRLLGG